MYIHVHKNTRDVCAGRAEAKVLLLYTASHELLALHEVDTVIIVSLRV